MLLPQRRLDARPFRQYFVNGTFVRDVSQSFALFFRQVSIEEYIGLDDCF